MTGLVVGGLLMAFGAIHASFGAGEGWRDPSTSIGVASLVAGVYVTGAPWPS